MNAHTTLHVHARAEHQTLHVHAHVTHTCSRYARGTGRLAGKDARPAVLSLGVEMSCEAGSMHAHPRARTWVCMNVHASMLVGVRERACRHVYV